MHILADVMVPSLERSEYMEELRNIGDNIARERLEHSALHPPTQPMLPTDASSSEVAQSRPLTPTDLGASCKAGESEDVQPSVEPHVPHVGPAFHIPMTQEKSLEDLPSQMDFGWQESVSPNPTPVLGTTRNMGGEFVEVSQIAQEAARDATAEPPADDLPVLLATTVVIAADAPKI